MHTTLRPAGSAKRHDNVDNQLSQGIQHMNIEDKKLNNRDNAPIQSDNNTRNNFPNKGASSRNTDLGAGAPASHAQLSTESRNYSEDVADRNMTSSHNNGQSNQNVNMKDHRVRRMPGQSSLVDNNHHVHADHNDDDPQLHMPTRKPLPSDSEFATEQDREQNEHAQTQSHHGPIDKQVEKQAAAAGINLGHSETTHRYTEHAPAVTHNTIQPIIHEIRHEKITRHIEQDHIVHRIQPINQIEYLPARHFILLPNGERKEVAEEDVERLLGLT